MSVDYLKFRDAKLGRTEQQQRDLVFRLIKERDALAEQLGHPVKPPDDLSK
jgi:hypothetical protein